MMIHRGRVWYSFAQIIWDKAKCAVETEVVVTQWFISKIWHLLQESEWFLFYNMVWMFHTGMETRLLQ